MAGTSLIPIVRKLSDGSLNAGFDTMLIGSCLHEATQLPQPMQRAA